ncbi:MAG: outer membrane lipoprotein carrier protein LolA [Bacteroidales bacterium]|nr:outer membrane lipoprotein carrier protein LolA [Bacteroidales bacterium]MBP5741507.1 outer membrane lipoprotein carrier protein LolA [Bacteroidales bacterium]
MRKLLILIFLSIGLASAAQDNLSVSRLMEANSFNTVKAVYVQTRHSALMTEDLVSTGILYLSSPDKVRWETLTPYQDVKVVRGDAKRRRGFRIPKEKDFSITPVEGKKDQFLLRPLTRDMKNLFDSVLVTVDPATYRIVSARINTSEEDWTELVFSAVTIDEPLDESLFKR